MVSHTQAGWLFTGRSDLIRELITAATGTPGATVVTGGAGAGKSAALARLVTLSDPQFRQEHAASLTNVPADLMPAVDAVDVAVLATGKLHTQILAQICRALRVPDPASAHAEPTIEERLTAWHTWLTGLTEPVTIVIDALDEAAHPDTLVREVLRRLEPDPTNPRIRLLVGVRSLAATDTPPVEAAVPRSTGELAEATVAALAARRIAVDEPPWWDQRDVADYIVNILCHTGKSPYASHADHAAAVARTLADRTGQSFLIARVAAGSLAAADTMIGAGDPSWLAAVDQGLVGVFRQDLHRSLPTHADRYRAVILLRATAFAYGAGLPWRDIWPVVAHAVDDDGGYYGDNDIAWLLGSRLGGYLVTDIEDDTTVYRPFHDLLRQTLRTRWRELLQPPANHDNT